MPVTRLLSRTGAVAAALVAALAFTLTPPAAAAQEPVVFADASGTFAKEIAWMGAQGISTGWVDEGTGKRYYRPSGTVTREQMAAFLYRYAGSPEVSLPGRPTFSDVPADATFYREIEWAVQEGITTGWSDGTFRPTAKITREQMAAFLFRLEGGTKPSSSVFVDTKASPFTGEIEWLAGEGISAGWISWKGRLYKPTSSITREAMAAFLYRLEHGATAVKAYTPKREAEADRWISTSNLNLRAEPSWGSAVKVSAHKHARARYLGLTWNGWEQVRIGGMTAWAPTQYTRETDPGVAADRMAIKIDELWFRSGPSNSSSVEMKIKQGERGYWTGIYKDNWSWVKFRGEWAWVPTTHLREAPRYNATKALAMAHSEVGYRSPNWNHNKFNTWAGGTNPWCMVYQMWVMDKIGYPQGMPFKLLYSDWAKAAMASGVVDTNVTASDLKPGMIVLVDWAPYYGPTHVGMVDHVNSNGTVVLVEGNTTDGTGDATRGVFVRTRNIVDMYGVFNPDDYARTIGY